MYSASVMIGMSGTHAVHELDKELFTCICVLFLFNHLQVKAYIVQMSNASDAYVGSRKPLDANSGSPGC